MPGDTPRASLLFQWLEVMKCYIAILLVLMLIIAAPALSLGQTPSRTGQQDETIVVGTSEVVLDVVVRDKKGRPVKNSPLLILKSMKTASASK